MKGTAINTLNYTGTVHLSLLVDAKTKVPFATIHNAGTSALFTFFTDCLVGDFVKAGAGRPKKIMLLQVTKDPNTGEVTDTQSQSHFIVALTNPEKVFSSTSQGESVRYSFVIPRTLIENEQVKFNRIGLYADGAKSPTDFSAYCDISMEEDNIPMWGSSSALALDWELNISNKSNK